MNPSDTMTKEFEDDSDELETLLRSTFSAVADTTDPKPEWGRVVADIGVTKPARTGWFTPRMGVLAGFAAAALVVGGIAIANLDSTNVEQGTDGLAEEGSDADDTDGTSPDTPNPPVDSRVPLITEPMALQLAESTPGVSRLDEADLGLVTRTAVFAQSDVAGDDSQGGILVSTIAGSEEMLGSYGSEGDDLIEIRGFTASVFEGAEGLLPGGFGIQFYDSDAGLAVSVGSPSAARDELIDIAENLVLGADGSPTLGPDAAARYDQMTNPAILAGLGSFGTAETTTYAVDGVGGTLETSLLVQVFEGSLDDARPAETLRGQVQDQTVRGVAGISSEWGQMLRNGILTDDTRETLIWEESPGVVIALSITRAAEPGSNPALDLVELAEGLRIGPSISEERTAALCQAATDLPTDTGEGYVGSQAHIADIGALAARPLPIEIEADLNRYFEFLTSGAIDTDQDPDSDLVENWPEPVQEALANVEAFIETNC